MNTALDNKKVQQDKKTEPKQDKKVVSDILKWDKEKVIELLNDNIELLLKGRSNYKTPVQIAGYFRLTQQNFRKKCYQDEDLGNLLHVFTGLWTEDIFKKSIDKGSISSSVEEYLKNEIQAFQGIGLEQQITWVLDQAPIVVNGEEIELELDKEEDTTKEPQALMWEVDNARDKE